MQCDYAVIGAGIVGLATARQLAATHPAARIVVLDKEAEVAAHQSSHNSGVIHAGVYYAPGSLKARYCREGSRATLDYCAAHGVPARVTGKLIVATEARELAPLDALAVRAQANGLECTRLDSGALREREPLVAGCAALYVPTTGIADYPALCRALAADLRAAGSEVRLNANVDAIRESRTEIVVESSQGAVRARYLIACAGMQADRLARLAGLAVDVALVPFRGDFYTLPRARAGLVSTLIYPVPDPALPFLGVHLTLTTAGTLMLGPSAMLAFARERYAKWAWVGADARSSLGFAGTWRLLARFPRAGLRELWHAASRRAYLAAARRYCPTLGLDDLATWSCGVRAQAVTRRGEMLHDFLFLDTPRSVHVLNAPSPAATAAFPIARAIVDRIARA